jgi:hypothetical protein
MNDADGDQWLRTEWTKYRDKLVDLTRRNQVLPARKAKARHTF